MFLVSVIFGTASIGFMFNTEDNADKAILAIDTGDSLVHITDDFGQTGRITRQSLHGVVKEDLTRGKVARAYQILHNLKSQNEAQKLAASDPALNMSRGPAVLQPGMMNGMR